MKYLLDTCTVSDFVKGNENTLNRIKDSVPSELTVSSITVMEIRYGLLHNPNRAKKIKKVINDFLKCLVILPYTMEEAEYSAQIRAALAKKGTPIGSYDLLIAGAALAHKMVLVTANEKEFKRIPDLKVENWRI